MKSAILVFPGINRERDMARALKLISGHEPAMVWHADTSLPKGTDLVVVPGTANVLWSNGSTNDSISVNTTGNYTVQLELEGCTASDVVHVTIWERVDTVLLGPDRTICPGQDLLLLYRARRREDLVFRDELDRLAVRRRARVVYLLGDSAEHLSSATLQRLVPQLPQRDVFMCGPPGMTSTVRAALAEAGLPPEQLHEERFAW